MNGKVFQKSFLLRVEGKINALFNPKYLKAYNKVKSNFREISDIDKEELYKCLRSIYFKDNSAYLDSDVGKADMENHMFNRLINFRNKTIPWLNSLKPLKQSRILEIGCGTGCTTVPLAEQGCELMSIDVNEYDIEVAKKRCEVYGVKSNIFVMNAIQINEISRGGIILISLYTPLPLSI